MFHEYINMINNNSPVNTKAGQKLFKTEKGQKIRIISYTYFVNTNPTSWGVKPPTLPEFLFQMLK